MTNLKFPSLKRKHTAGITGLSSFFRIPHGSNTVKKVVPNGEY